MPLDQGQQDALRELERTTLKAIYGEITEQDVKRGTGLISNIFAAANAVGGTFAPEFFSKVFKNTEQARLNLGLFNLMAVSALAVNPRLAVYDIQRVEKILPKPTRLLTNPASEAEMFQKLVRTMELQRARLLEAIRMGDAAALDNLSGTMKKVKELDNILQMVRISPDPANMTLEEAMTKTESKYE